MATCPSCGTSSRDELNAFTIEKSLETKPLGSFSVAGNQMKTVGQWMLRLKCRCGWSIAGSIINDQFVGNSSTQIFPT